jgi:hypothetical protein
MALRLAVKTVGFAVLDFKFGDQKVSKQTLHASFFQEYYNFYSGLKAVATQNLKRKHPKHGITKTGKQGLGQIWEGKTEIDSKLCPLFDKIRG